jgi:hypothetical protein
MADEVAGKQKNEIVIHFLQTCVLPRCNITTSDALYCTKFVQVAPCALLYAPIPSSIPLPILVAFHAYIPVPLSLPLPLSDCRAF